jgi:U3 small nucleolar RNA-associated protein MPP10
LEDIIKGRIRDGAFDDPIRKIAPPDRGDFRSRSIQLDTEKSSKGLAEIYEQDYLNQTQAQLGSLPSGDAAQMTELQQQAVKLFKRICFKLDALANANFTPLKFKDDEVDIKKLNVAAIRMEEVTPTTVSEAVVLAPEEIYRKTKSGGNLVGESEMTKEDRKRKRRRHKEAGKKHNAEKASKAKVAERLGEKKRLSDKDAMAQIKEIRNVRIAEQTDTTQYTNSAQVFKKLQESANNPQANTKSRRPAHAPTGQIAANLKL